MQEIDAWLTKLSPNILQNMSEGVVIENTEGYFTFVNNFAANLLGYTPAELIGQHWTLIVPPDQQPLVHTANERRRRGEADRYELELVRRDGTRVSVIVAGNPYDEQGRWAGSYAVFTDITERKRAEELLRASQERYHYAIEATRQLIYDYDVVTGQIYWAGAIQDLTGFTPEEFARVDIHVWEEMIHPDDRAKAIEQLERAQHERRVYQVEYRFQRKDGSYIWVADYGTFLYDAHGRAHRMIGAMRDISERKRADAALHYREAILSAVAFASETLFRSSDWTENIQAIIARLGQAADVSRVYIFENYTDETGTFYTTQRYEWVAPGITPQIDNPDLQALNLHATGFTRWIETMSRRQPIYGLVRDFPSGEREFLAAQDIRSIIVMPIYTGTQWWGFIGFDECRYEREWSAPEIDALRIAADNLGSAIARLQTERALRLSEDRYRDLIEHSPAIIVLHDLQGRVLSVNRAASETLGYSIEELAKTTIQDHLTPSVRHRFAEYCARVQQQGHAHGLMLVRTRSGETRILEYTSTLRTEGVATPVVRAMARDVTELRHAEQKLHQRANEFAALYQVAQELTMLTDLHALLQKIVTYATNLLHAPSGAIFLYNPTRHELELAVTHNFPFQPPIYLKLGEGGSGRAAQLRQTLIVDDYSTWEHRTPQANGIPIRAAVYAPLIFQGELIGVLNILELDDSTRKFTEDDARLLSLFATQAAAAVHNARLLQQTQQRATQLALLYDAALTLNRTLEVPAIIQHLLNIVTRTLHADHADFFRYDATTRTLRLDSTSGYANEFLDRLREHIFVEGDARGLVGLVAAERTPLYLPNVSEDSRYIIFDPSIRSALWVPVEHAEQLYGVLAIVSERENAFAETDQRLAVLFANQVAVALERALLFQAEQTRRAEISALYDLARQLADTDNVERVCNLVVQHAITTLPIAFARLALLENNTLVLCAQQTIGALPTTANPRERTPLAHLPYCRAILEQPQPRLLRADDSRPSTTERAWLGLDLVPAAYTVPLYAEGQPIGLLLLGTQNPTEQSPLGVELLQRIRSIGDQAAGAIRRAKLREQTEQRLRQVQALHTIDMTISASMDVNTTLQILLPTLLAQLQADAVALLLFNPATHTLTYLAGRGFRSRAIEQTTLGVGKEYAGRAVLERKTISEPNLSEHLANLQRHFLVTEEKFVSCVCAPLIAKGQIKGVLEFFFRTPFTPTQEWQQILDAFSVQAALALDNAELFRNLQRAHTELSLSYEAMIEGWARTIEAREQVSPGHNRRVADWAFRVARALGVSAPQLQQIRYGALLHNLEYAFPPDIPSRPCAEDSTTEPVSLQQLQKVYELLSSRPMLRPLLDIPYSYHENWDGSGYPRGLRGEQIPLGARIVAVVDTWEHCISQSNAATPQDHQAALDYLLAQSGIRFDPHIVRVFLQLLETSEENITP